MLWDYCSCGSWVNSWFRTRWSLIRAQTELQMNYNQIWNTLSYALNGFVFVVLGYIVPEVILEIVRNEPQNLVF